jgi:GTPase involved in cell partitioning and DNA repair
VVNPAEKAKGSKNIIKRFEVQKYGSARICMIGFPSVGKSTLLSELTETQVANFLFNFLINNLSNFLTFFLTNFLINYLINFLINFLTFS